MILLLKFVHVNHFLEIYARFIFYRYIYIQIVISSKFCYKRLKVHTDFLLISIISNLLTSHSKYVIMSGRYWDRTSDPFHVKEVRYRCANRPQLKSTRDRNHPQFAQYHLHQSSYRFVLQ